MDLSVFYQGHGHKVKMKFMNIDPVSDKVLIKIFLLSQLTQNTLL